MARSRAVNVILNLRDKFTRPIQRTVSETKKFEREVRRVENNIKKSTNKIATQFTELSKKVAKSIGGMGLKGLQIGGTVGLGAVSFAGTAGLMEGMNYEGYRVQLETATKDAEKAAKLMQDAIQFANKTPFETGEIIEATSKFESMGLSAEKWLSITADMAGATSKDMIQAVEAVIDAVASGEFERLKEFGIKKDALAGFDDTGKLVDQVAMVESLMAMMQEKYAGGAEALSKTSKGLWSTVTGVFKNGMAKVVGINDDGTVRVGSLLDRIKGWIASVADTFTRWQQDGTIEKIASTIDGFVSGAIGLFSKLRDLIGGMIERFKTFYEEVSNNGQLEKFMTLIKNIAGVILSVVVVQKLWTAGLKLHSAWTRRHAIQQGIVNGVTKIWNALAVANPWGLVITLIIGALVLLVLNWEKVVAWCKVFAEQFMIAFNKARECVMQLYNRFAEVFPMIANTVSGVVEGVKNVFGGIIEFIKGVFTGNWEQALNGLKSIAEGIFEILKNIFLAPFRLFATGFNWVIDKINSLSFDVPEWVPIIGGETWGFNIPKIPNFATGTKYHRGGLLRMNEGGRGEIANLPNGTQIIPHDISKKAVGAKGDVIVHVNIHGNVYGEEDIVNRVGNAIARRVILAIPSV